MTIFSLICALLNLACATWLLVSRKRLMDSSRKLGYGEGWIDGYSRGFEHGQLIGHVNAIKRLNKDLVRTIKRYENEN